MEAWIIASLIVFFASTLQSATGFGFSVMATPFLLIVFEAHTAIQINIVLSLFISAIMIPRIYSEINKPLLVRLLKGAVFGAPIGLLVFAYLNPDLLKKIISILIIIMTALLIINIKIMKSPLKDSVAGVFSGILTVSLGMPGPPLLIYFSGAKIKKEVLRGTTLAFFLFIYSSSLILQIAIGASDAEVWLTALALAPVAAVGTVLGQYVFRYINQKAFRAITYLILGATGVHLLVSAL